MSSRKGHVWYSKADWFKHMFTSTDDVLYKKLRKTYHHMNQRCSNQNDNAYAHYGGRGIKVCDRWQEIGGDGFKNFALDMGSPMETKLSIDRIDNDGDYTPDNCRWADRNTQANNTTRNVYYRYKGKKMTLTNISRDLGVKHQAMFQRIHAYGWTIDKAVNTPIRKRG